MLILEYGFQIVFSQLPGLAIYGTAYLLAGHDVLKLALRKAMRFDFFNEFFLLARDR